VPARLIDGTSIAAAMRAELAPAIAALGSRGVVPGLAAVLVGDNPASATYVRMKAKACEEAGLYHETVKLPAHTSAAELEAVVDRLNADPRLHGILIQLPLPGHLAAPRILERVDPRKDVDGFHPVNVGRVTLGDPTGFCPATPLGIRALLLRSGIETTGRHAVVVGRSAIVGRPMASLLLRDAPGGNATVTVCHSRTPDIGALARQADILIVAIGRPEFVRGTMVKPGAAVVDVGINRVEDPSAPRGYRLVGDVHFAEARARASAITPVPGGVGPMTITMLLANTVQAAEQWAPR